MGSACRRDFSGLQAVGGVGGVTGRCSSGEGLWASRGWAWGGGQPHLQPSPLGLNRRQHWVMRRRRRGTGVLWPRLPGSRCVFGLIVSHGESRCSLGLALCKWGGEKTPLPRAPPAGSSPGVTPGGVSPGPGRLLGGMFLPVTRVGLGSF